MKYSASCVLAWMASWSLSWGTNRIGCERWLPPKKANLSWTVHTHLTVWIIKRVEAGFKVYVDLSEVFDSFNSAIYRSCRTELGQR